MRILGGVFFSVLSESLWTRESAFGRWAIVVSNLANLRSKQWFPGGIFIPSAVAIGVVVFLAVCASTSTLQAGCEFGAHDNGLHSLNDENQESSPRLGFLGKWVYVGGEIKFEPWRGLPPCQGPGCRSNDKLPVSNSSANSNLRSAPAGTPVRRCQLAEVHAATSRIEPENLSAIAGFPHEHEYPP